MKALDSHHRIEEVFALNKVFDLKGISVALEINMSQRTWSDVAILGADGVGCSFTRN